MPQISPNSETVLWDSFFTSTRNKFLGKPKNQVYRTPETWDWVQKLPKSSGTMSGSRVDFGMTLGSYGGTTFLPFGSMDTLTVQTAEITTAGWVPIFTAADLCGISEQFMKANTGEGKRYDYVANQLQAMIFAQDEAIEAKLWSASQATNDPQSIAVTLSTTTGSGSPQNVSRSTYSNYRQTYTNLAGAAFSASGLNGFRTIYHSLSKMKAGGVLDTIFMDGALHATWERVTDGKERTEMATSGTGKKPIISEAAVFRTCEIIWVPTNYPDSTSARFMNSSTWHYDPFMSMKPGEARRPMNGLWYAYPVVQSGVFLCDSLKSNGLVANFTNS